MLVTVIFVAACNEKLQNIPFSRTESQILHCILLYVKNSLNLIQCSMMVDYVKFSLI